MSTNTLVSMRVDSRLSVANPASDYSIYLKQQSDMKEQQQKQQQPSFPSQHQQEHQFSKSQDISRRYQPNYPRHPSPLSSDDSSNNTSSGSSVSSESSTSHEQLSEPVRYSLVDNPVRPPPQRQPAHRSKLSMQYTPSESGDSDDEPLSLPQPDKRFGFAAGRPVELNSGRTINSVPRQESSQAVMASSPAVTDGVDIASQTPEKKKKKKKISLAKRLSNFFGGSKKSKEVSRNSASAAISNTSDAACNKDDRGQSSPAILNASRASKEHTVEGNKSDLRPPNNMFHQRSWSLSDVRRGSCCDNSNNSSTDALNTMGNGNLTRDSLVQESRDRKFRDSGFEDSEGLGHRRYSSTASAIVTSRPLSSYPYQKPPLLGGDVSLVDQQQHQSRLLSQTQFHPPQAQFFSYPPGIELEGSGRVSPRHEPIHEEQLIQRRVTLGDLSTLDPPPKIGDNSTRRSSTSSIPETLVSRIDREKSTVCFQAPIHKQEIYSRDANLDPLISNLVQLHRRDYYTNSRLGGTPQPVQQAPPLQLQMPPPLPVAEPPSGKERSNAPKKDSAVAFNSTYQYPVSGSHPPLVNSGVPQPDLNNRRLSTILPQVQAQAPAPFPAGQRFSTSTNTSNANLLNAAAMASAKQQQEQSQLISPQITPTTGVNGSLGRNRGSPTRQASSTYFNLPPQQHQQQQLKVDTSSAVLSPGLGATASTSAYNHDLSVAMQIQQQQIAQQQQQTQQQIDQIRLQQQMLHQSQQLQQQLDQARAAVAVPSPTERMAGTLPSHQQQPIIGNMPVQFTTTPVLTTTMGYGMGMGMGMNPQSMGVNMVNMGVSTLGGYGQTATPMITQGMVPQLIMSPQMGPQLTQQLTPHLMAFPATSLYTYQQQPQLATMMPTAAAPNGGRTA